MSWSVKYKRVGWVRPGRLRFEDRAAAEGYAATLQSGPSDEWAHLAPLEFVRVYETGPPHRKRARLFEPD